MTDAVNNSSVQRITLILFSFTLFLSASLMFAVQPMVGKMLLPIIGGTPAGWIVAMAFFQVMLLAGYFFAHLLSRFQPRSHGFLFIAALCAGVYFLPMGLPDTFHGDWPISLEIFRLLSLAVAIPFVALSATSSTIQRLFTTTGHSSARDPYFLYAASNLGSFTGLFMYPLLAEPLLGITMQSQMWFYGYAGLIALTIFCLLPARKSLLTSDSAPQSAPVHTDEKISNRQRLYWILLAFFPSSLLSGVTTHISTDIFSAPMIWVLPLGVYLLTFVIAFAKKPPVTLAGLSHLQPIIVAIAIGFLLAYNPIVRMSWYCMAFHIFAFGLTALMCHMRLAAARPADSTRHLTEFYLMMSIGGALGGVLNAFIIPYTLDRLIEYPAMLILSLLLNPTFKKDMNFVSKGILGFSLIAILLFTAYINGNADTLNSTRAGIVTPQVVLIDIIMASIFIMMATNIKTVFYGCLFFFSMAEFVIPKDVLLTTRNFFGVIKIFDRPMFIDDKQYTARYMYHGTTTHGIQILEAPYEQTPTTYFSEQGPAGNVFQLYNPKKIAIVGLGVGTMNCFSTPENEMTFIEIDQGVVDVARSHFTFLSACKGKKEPRIIVGDGRIEIEKLKDETFDLIVIDAFSSDTIPIHLLTTDALRSYFERLGENGMVTLNISNRYFNLAPVLIKNAEQLGLSARVKLDIPVNPEDPIEVQNQRPYAAASFWMTIARKPETLAPLTGLSWINLPPQKDLRPWTDDYTNLLGMLHTARTRQLVQSDENK